MYMKQGKMDDDEVLEVSSIYSIAGELDGHELKHTRPFRAPYCHMYSQVLIGGGAYTKPWEVTLAHKGILFLYELPEFSRKTLESLRLPFPCKDLYFTNRYFVAGPFPTISTVPCC